MSIVSSASRRLSIIDETLSSTSAEYCELYMHWAAPFFTFSVLDRNRNKFIALCEYRLGEKANEEEISALINQDEILGNNGYSKSCIAVSTGKAALIPAALFTPERAETLLSCTAKLQQGDVLCADHLRFTDAVHLYALPASFAEMLKNNFSSVLVHTGTVFIESELMRNKHKTERTIAVNVRQRSFDVVVCEGDKLILYNSFHYQTSEDFIYFLLHVMEQLELNPEKTDVTFTGEIEKQQSIYLITSRYIRNISFGRRPEEFNFSYGFDQVAKHAHHTLLNEYLCVS